MQQAAIAETDDYQICQRCVMDTSDTRIRFDQDGVCDHCTTFDQDIRPHWHTDHRGRENLMRVAAQIRAAGKGKPFDCILGVSGGIDSSYLAYIAKKELDLRPLIFHVDAGWNSQIAVNNIEKLVDHLGVDLYTEVIDWEEMRDLQLSYFKAGVPHIDTPQDHAFFATMYNFASKYRVSYILTGANYSTECVRNPVEWMYYQSDSTQLRDIHRTFGTRPLRSFPVTSILWHKLYLRYARNIRLVTPLNDLPYQKEDAMRLLADELGWQRYPQKHFESRFTRFYESFWLPERFGYDTRRVQYSSLILTDQMSRNEALAKLAGPAYDPEQIDHEFEYVANKLRISTDELRSYLESPTRSYRDFRSQRRIYAAGAAAMRWLGLERGGKR